MPDSFPHGAVHDWPATKLRVIYCAHRGTNATHYHAKPADVDPEAAAKGLATMVAICSSCAEACGYAKGLPLCLTT